MLPLICCATIDLIERMCELGSEECQKNATAEECFYQLFGESELRFLRSLLGSSRCESIGCDTVCCMMFLL